MRTFLWAWLLVVGLVSCAPPPVCHNLPDHGDFEIYLEHDDIAAWGLVSNHFDEKVPDDFEKGLLIQLGGFEGKSGELPRSFQAAEFEGPEVDDRFQTNEFKWINLYADTSPITSEEATYFYPSSTTGCAVSVGSDVDPRCIRTPTLHADLYVLNIITAWPGNRDLRFEATKPLSDGHRPEYFWIPGDLHIRVYEINDDGELEEIAKYEPGQVERMVLEYTGSPPESGTKAGSPFGGGNPP